MQPSSTFTLLAFLPHLPPTMSFVSRKVLSINNQVMVCVQLPELAVDDVKVFIGEEVCDLVDVRLILEKGEDLEEVATTQLTGSDTTIPITIHNVEDTTDYLCVCVRERERESARGKISISMLVIAGTGKNMR